MALALGFPDLRHPERTVPRDVYIDQLFEASPGSGPEAPPVPAQALGRTWVTTLVGIVHDRVRGVVGHADARGEDAGDALARLDPDHDPGIHGLVPSLHAIAGESPERLHALHALAAAVLRGVVRVNRRELAYRGMDRVRRANARFAELLRRPTPRTRRPGAPRGRRVRLRVAPGLVVTPGSG